MILAFSAVVSSALLSAETVGQKQRNAAERQPQEFQEIEQPVVSLVVPLTPEAGTAAEFQDFRIEYLTDGRRVLRGETQPTRATEVYDDFYFVVDPILATYRVTRSLVPRPQELRVGPIVDADEPTPNIGAGENAATTAATGAGPFGFEPGIRYR